MGSEGKRGRAKGDFFFFVNRMVSSVIRNTHQEIPLCPQTISLTIYTYTFPSNFLSALLFCPFTHLFPSPHSPFPTSPIPPFPFPPLHLSSSSLRILLSTTLLQNKSLNN